MGTRVRVFLNAKSGGTECEAASLTRMFAAHGCLCVVTDLDRSVDLPGLARTDPEDMAFIAAGGDGTVNCVAAVVAGTGRRMGVLPVGTLNHFAKDLDLPQDLETAVAVAAGSRSREVDAAEVNGCVFVNNSSLGVYPLMVLDREKMKRSGWNRWLSLVAASAKSFVVLRRMQVQLELEGATQVYTTPFLFVGNNEYCLEGSRLGKRDCVDRGTLALYLAHGIGRMGLLRLGLAALLGRLKTLPEYQEYRVETFTVAVRRRRPRVSLDGEVKRIPGPLAYKIRPGALQVLCAPEIAAEAEA